MHTIREYNDCPQTIDAWASVQRINCGLIVCSPNGYGCGNVDCITWVHGNHQCGGGRGASIGAGIDYKIPYGFGYSNGESIDLL